MRKIRSERWTNVYAMQCGQYIKIGRSNKIKERLDDLQIGNPEKLELLGSIRAPAYIEYQIHKELADYCHRGEWFNATPEVLDLVDSLINSGDYLDFDIASRSIEVTPFQRYEMLMLAMLEEVNTEVIVDGRNVTIIKRTSKRYSEKRHEFVFQISSSRDISISDCFD